MNIYMYFIGRPEQSMGEGFFKHIDDHERVLRWLLTTTTDNNLPEHYELIVSRQIELMLRTHYSAYDKQAKLTKGKKKELANFDVFLRRNYPNHYKSAKVSGIIKRIMNPLKDTKSAKLLRYLKENR